METDIIIEESKSDPGMWYWAFTIDGEVSSDGEAVSESDAKTAVRLAREEWEHRND